MKPLWLILSISASITASIGGNNLSDPCPSACFCDNAGEYVSCVGDGLWKIPTDLPKSAVRLELRNFVLPILTITDLNGLTELKELKIQQAQITRVDGGALSNLDQLVRLDLSQNYLQNVSYEVFDGLRNLRYMDLSANYLANIESAFRGLLNVEQLNLRANQLVQLNDDTFVGLTKVQYLNLDFNAISRIKVGAFQYLTNLAHLILSNNPLKTLSRLDFFGNRLQYIDISNAGLERVPQSLTRFVRDLRLAKNNLTRVSAGDFESYPYLGLLVLDDNNIEEIENDALGRQECLLRLWLNGNRLSKVPVNLPPSLHAIYLEENLLENLRPYSFKGLIHLEQLFLQRNRIANLSTCAFCDLLSLTSLDLQANQIQVLNEGAFFNLTKLQVLDLSQNNLKYLGARCFHGLEALKILQMSRVPTIIEFDEHLFDQLKKLQKLEMYDSVNLTGQIVSSARVLHGLRHLQELNIMHNKLTNVRSDLPSFFPLLKVIKLSGNSWHCGNNITWLANWIKMSNVQFYRSYEIRCNSPEKLYSKPIMMLREDDIAETTDVPPVTREIIAMNLTVANNSSTSDLSWRPVLELESRNLTLEDPTTERWYSRSEGTLPSTTETTETPPTFSQSTGKPVSQSSTTTMVELLSVPSSTLTISSTRRSTSTREVSSTLSSRWHLIASTMKPPLPPQHHRSHFPNRTVSQVQRLYISTLGRPSVPGASSEHGQWSQVTAITVSTSLAGACLLIMTITVIFFTVYRCRRRCANASAKLCSVRRSSSISYHPQRDEVSIVTVSEGTVGWKTSTHHGLGNKLYYALENVDMANEPSSCSVKEDEPNLRRSY